MTEIIQMSLETSASVVDGVDASRECDELGTKVLLALASPDLIFADPQRFVHPSQLVLDIIYLLRRDVVCTDRDQQAELATNVVRLLLIIRPTQLDLKNGDLVDQFPERYRREYHVNHGISISNGTAITALPSTSPVSTNTRPRGWQYHTSPPRVCRFSPMSEIVAFTASSK